MGLCMEEPPTKACSNWVARKEHTQYEIVYPHSPQDHRSGVCCNSYFNKPRRGAGSCPHPARLPARPALPSAPGPLLTAPDCPRPGPQPRSARPGSRVPAASGAPERPDGGAGGGAARAAGPRGGRTPPPGPAAFPPSPFEQLPPPSSCGPLQPLRRGGCGRYSSPRLGPRARP